jgi:hypothetical protein
LLITAEKMAWTKQSWSGTVSSVRRVGLVVEMKYW